MDSNNAPIIEASESALEAYYLVGLYLFINYNIIRVPKE